MQLGRVKIITEAAMKEHGLIEKGWKFRFSKGTRQFGCCRDWKKEITISKHLSRINDEERVMLTILHEIAHALVGAHNGHTNVWRRKCIEIGGNGQAKYTEKDTECITPKTQRIENNVILKGKSYNIGDPIYFLFGRRTVCGKFKGYKARNYKYPFIVEYEGKSYKMNSYYIKESLD